METDLIKNMKIIRTKREKNEMLIDNPTIILLEAKGLLTSDEVDDLVEYDKIIYRNIHKEIRRRDLISKKELVPSEIFELETLTKEIDNQINQIK